MKKILSLIIAAVLLFTCSAAPARSNIERKDPAACDEPLELVPSSMTLPLFSVSSGEKLRVRFYGELVPGSEFTWASSDTNVVRVDANGGLTAVAPGTAVVSALYEDGEYGEAQITVVENEGFTTVAQLDPIDMALPFYSEEVGIGPLCGGQPVILKRFIHNPGCGNDPQPDPDEYITTEGWTYSYAVIYRIRMHYGQSVRFAASVSTADGMHASNAYICIYDQFFGLWAYSGGSAGDPYGQVTLDSYEDSYFYLVITPASHTDDAGSGYITLYAYDLTQPYAPGDVNTDHYVTAADALTVMRFVLDLIDLEDSALPLADMNGDNEISTEDALLILRAAMGAA